MDSYVDGGELIPTEEEQECQENLGKAWWLERFGYYCRKKENRV